MRIALLMLAASPWARSVALRLSDLGHDVHVIDFQHTRTRHNYISGSFQNDAVQALAARVSAIHYLESHFTSHARYLTTATTLASICRKTRADILLTLYGGGLGVMAWLSGFRPYCIYTVGSDILLAKKLFKPLVRRSLQSSAMVFSNGEFLADRTRVIAPRANVVPLLIGIDTSRFTMRSPPAEPIRLLCNRGFLPVYNNAYLIDGLALLPTTTKPLKVTFTSRGPLLPAVKAQARSVLPPFLRNAVEFLCGVTDDEMLSLLQSSHIFVSLSRSDGTATSLLEAMGCGLLPVLSDIPQNREWISPGEDNGLLCPLDTPHILTQKLHQAITNAHLRETARHINSRLVHERADSEKNMGILAHHLQHIVDRVSFTDGARRNA